MSRTCSNAPYHDIYTAIICAHAHTYTHNLTCTHTHTLTHMHTNTHTHTHTHRNAYLCVWIVTWRRGISLHEHTITDCRKIDVVYNVMLTHGD